MQFLQTKELLPMSSFTKAYDGWPIQCLGGECEKEETEEEEEERERMFEKALTPSDVGKLNRLVIPKQQAERHFSLGLRQLRFEDHNGNVWKFRYSYWSSSQSYVLTKGWSRFVRDNQLCAGDVVFFDRQLLRGEPHLFIGCQRRHSCTSVVTAFDPDHFLPASGHDHDNCIRGEAKGWKSTPAPVPATLKRLRLFGVNLDFPANSPPEPNGSLVEQG